MSATPWYTIANVDEIDSPALLVYPDRVAENIQRMVAIASDPLRLRPHVKTNKMPEVVRMFLARGVNKFKCATIAEAEMTATCGAPDILFAYQPVGPAVRRFIELVRAYPRSTFSTIADNPDTLRALSDASQRAGRNIEVLLDIDCGQHRTGIAPGLGALELYRFLSSLPGLIAGGLHAYDGHVTDSDPSARVAKCESAFAPVEALRAELIRAGLKVPRVVAGGTPTFPIHAKRSEVECSPGTCVFWDFGYGGKFGDLPFQPAALVLTRVVSKPGANRLCLDLGHKAIASEMPHPRVHFLNLPDATAVTHSEEHLVIESNQAHQLPISSVLYGVPWHICPTVNLHSEAIVIRNGNTKDRWMVTARERKLRSGTETV